MSVRSPLTAFDDLATAIQVGTQRTSPDRAEVVRDWSSDRADKCCLVDVGVLDLMRRAGWTPRAGTEPTPVAPAESMPYAESSVGPLSAALDLGATECVLEWVDAARAKGVLAPPAVLVRLLDLPAKHRPDLAPVLGRRADWLRSLMGQDVRAEEAEADERDWTELDWHERRSLVERLGPTAEHEHVLARALTDRRKEVREAAARLLARIPESAFAQDMAAVATGRIQVGRKLLAKHLVVDAPNPEALPKAVPRMAAGAFGPKALALIDLVRLIPPSFWEKETGLAPAELVSLARQCDYVEALQTGWILAVVQTFGDQRWCDALLAASLDDLLTEHSAALWRLASDAAVDRAVAILAKKEPNQCLELVANRPGVFSSKVSAILLEIAKGLPYAGGKSLAHRLHLSILSSLDEPWPDRSEPTRHHWQRILSLREQLLKSLGT